MPVLSLDNHEDEFVPDPRPLTRAECADVPRPCPYASCRFNLLLTVLPSGNLQFPHGHDDPTLLHSKRSCALDVAEQGGATLELVGAALGITRERTRQIVTIGVGKMRQQSVRLELRAKRLREE
ncbi:MAG: hypothetical protein ACRD3I_01825 [Terriglobales bacterium]